MVDAEGDIYLCQRGEVTSYWVVRDDDARNGVAEIDWNRSDACVPDLDNPATKGWLLAMLREATGSVEVRVERWNDASLMRMRAPSPYDGPFWQVEAMGPYAHTIVARRDGTTEGEALARALLAAWGAND